MKTTLSILILALLPLTASAQTLQGPVLDPDRPGAARPGFYLGLDLGGANLRLEDSIEQRFEDAGLDFGTQGGGGGLFFGYSWSNSFALELKLNGNEITTSDVDVEAGYGEVAIGLRAPLMPRARFSPYLEGTLGGAVIAFSGDSIENRAVAGGTTGIGGGVEIHLSRRFAVDFGYRFSLISFEREFIDTADGEEEIEISGSSQAHRWAMRTTFSF